MNRHSVTAGVFLMGLVLSTAAVAEVRDESPARTVVARWLAAFRAQDDAAVAAMSARPLVLEGVDMATGPERRKCAELADKRPEKWPLRFSAADQPGLVSAVRCLRRDEVFINALPQSAPDTWPKSVNRPRAAGATAALVDIRPAELPTRLRKYQTQIKAFKAAVTLVHLFATDNNGVTVAGVFVVSKEATPRVKGLFISTRFEE
jgi:hypothetical protein